MDLINWSLNAIDTIFSTIKLGSGEPVFPDGTFAAGYTMDVWERWRIVCLAALSVEDIEDIYLFGTMITGLLLIGLGFTLGYRKIHTHTCVYVRYVYLPICFVYLSVYYNCSMTVDNNSSSSSNNKSY